MQVNGTTERGPCSGWGQQRSPCVARIAFGETGYGGMIKACERGWKEVKLGVVQSLKREDEETLVRVYAC